MFAHIILPAVTNDIYIMSICQSDSINNVLLINQVINQEIYFVFKKCIQTNSIGKCSILESCEVIFFNWHHYLMQHNIFDCHTRESCKMECRITVLMITAIDISPMVQQQLTYFQLSLEGCMLQRCHSSLILHKNRW